MHSALYVGRLRHRRFAPVSHDFGYLGDPPVALDRAVRDHVERESGSRPLSGDYRGAIHQHPVERADP